MTDEPPRSRFRDVMRVRTVSNEVTEQVPRSLRVATAYAWRLVVIAAAIAIVIWLIIQLKLLVIPMLIGILVTALVWPAFSLLVRRGLPRWAAVIIAVIGTLTIITGLLWLAIWQIRQQFDSVRDSTVASIGDFRQYLIDGPLHLTEEQIDGYLEQGLALLQEQSQFLLTGALAVGTVGGHVLTGVLLAVFILICLLADGGGIWRWTVKLFPRTARPAVDGSAKLGWRTVVNYARTQLLVAVIDAIGIGLGAFLLGVPLAIPVAVLVFLGAFVPFVGAVVTGAFAVFLALVYNGPWIALAMLAVVLAVQQVEGHLLQPILMGAAVKVHPLAVVLVVAGGAMIAGIPGALFAVPIAAFVNVFALSLSSGSWRTGSRPSSSDLIWSTVPRKAKRR